MATNDDEIKCLMGLSLFNKSNEMHWYRSLTLAASLGPNSDPAEFFELKEQLKQMSVYQSALRLQIHERLSAIVHEDDYQVM